MSAPNRLNFTQPVEVFSTILNNLLGLSFMSCLIIGLDLGNFTKSQKKL